MQCDYGMLLARTNIDVPKHGGISWFVFKLDQPGVTIRPLREMTGDSVFNEVFFDDAEVDHRDLIGGESNGWAVTQTTLLFERTGIGAGGAHAGFPVPGPKGGMLGRRAGDATHDAPPGNSLTMSLPEVLALARRMGRSGDPVLRQKIARLVAYVETGRWNAQRSRDEASRGGGQRLASVGKLSQTRIVKLAAEIGVDLLGPDGMLCGTYAPGEVAEGAGGTDGGRFTEAFVFSPASSIYGGADEIQRNIVSERTLGLPRDHQADKGLTDREMMQRLAGPGS